MINGEKLMSKQKTNINCNDGYKKDKPIDCDYFLQSVNVETDENNSKKVKFILSNNDKDKNSISFYIDKQTAKMLVEKISKEFVFDETYKSIFADYFKGIEHGIPPRFIRLKIDLINRIIKREGLKSWEDLLNIRNYYRIYRKYEDRCEKIELGIKKDGYTKALTDFELAFRGYWADKYKLPDQKFMYFLFSDLPRRLRLSSKQIDMCLSIIKELMLEEKIDTWDKLMSSLDILEKKYKSTQMLNDQKNKLDNILLTLKYLKEYRCYYDYENKMLNSLDTPLNPTDYVI